ncbi:MAG: hypothetical protein AB7J35_21555 [Dehalococcoidia bacterium]
MAEITLAESSSRAMQEAENFCWRANVGIVAPEHLLAGCLKVLNASGHPGLPSDDQLESALLMAQGMSEDALTQNVMFGSAAREAINFTARLVAQAGGGEIDPLTLAYGIIQSGELNPMFFSALATTKSELLNALTNTDDNRRD